MHNLTATDTFTSTVQGVNDGDRPTAANLNAGPQALLNRTEWLGNRVGSACSGSFTASAYVTGDFFAIGSPTDLGTPDYAFETTQYLRVPAAGVYLVYCSIPLKSDDPNAHTEMTVGVCIESTVYGLGKLVRASTDTTAFGYVQIMVPVVITTPASERIRFKLVDAADTTRIPSSQDARYFAMRIA